MCVSSVGPVVFIGFCLLASFFFFLFSFFINVFCLVILTVIAKLFVGVCSRRLINFCILQVHRDLPFYWCYYFGVYVIYLLGYFIMLVKL